jgi:hypothetical protein
MSFWFKLSDDEVRDTQDALLVCLLLNLAGGGGREFADRVDAQYG